MLMLHIANHRRHLQPSMHLSKVNLNMEKKNKPVFNLVAYFSSYLVGPEACVGVHQDKIPHIKSQILQENLLNAIFHVIILPWPWRLCSQSCCVLARESR